MRVPEQAIGKAGTEANQLYIPVHVSHEMPHRLACPQYRKIGKGNRKGNKIFSGECGGDPKHSDPVTTEREESMLRCHVYEAPATPGRTPKGSVAIGELPIGLLSRQPSRVATWFTALPLHDNTRLLMWELISPVLEAAIADHIIHDNPFKSTAITKPKHVDREVTAWDAETMVRVAGGLPARWRPMRDPASCRMAMAGC